MVNSLYLLTYPADAGTVGNDSEIMNLWFGAGRRAEWTRKQ